MNVSESQGEGAQVMICKKYVAAVASNTVEGV